MMVEAKVVDINAADVGSLQTAVSLVAERGHLPCLKVLLDGGADPMAKDKVCVECQAGDEYELNIIISRYYVIQDQVGV